MLYVSARAQEVIARVAANTGLCQRVHALQFRPERGPKAAKRPKVGRLKLFGPVGGPSDSGRSA